VKRMVEELLLGDNPFIGVSHLTQEKAREESGEALLGNKIAVFEAAVNGGATGFTFSTHESNLELLTYLSVHRKDLLEAMNYYILCPYVQSYVRRANIGGTPRLLRSTLAGMLRTGSVISDTLAALVSMKPERLAGLFINAEIAPYLDVLPRERVKAVLLHEIITDCLVAFDLIDLLKSLGNYVRKTMRYGFGLHTKNFGYFHRLEVLTGICPEYIMTSINPLGYMMAPSRQDVEKSLDHFGKESKVIAINILASGAVDLDEALKYICRHKDRIYAVTTASTKPHRILENFQRLSMCL